MTLYIRGVCPKNGQQPPHIQSQPNINVLAEEKVETNTLFIFISELKNESSTFFFVCGLWANRIHLYKSISCDLSLYFVFVRKCFVRRQRRRCFAFQGNTDDRSAVFNATWSMRWNFSVCLHNNCQQTCNDDNDADCTTTTKPKHKTLR